jgi:hypothetical protein
MSELQTGLQSWHDFYMTAAGAAAVLLGLLFLGVSLHWIEKPLSMRFYIG